MSVHTVYLHRQCRLRFPSSLRVVLSAESQRAPLSSFSLASLLEAAVCGGEGSVRLVLPEGWQALLVLAACRRYLPVALRIYCALLACVVCTCKCSALSRVSPSQCLFASLCDHVPLRLIPRAKTMPPKANKRFWNPRPWTHQRRVHSLNAHHTTTLQIPRA